MSFGDGQWPRPDITPIGCAECAAMIPRLDVATSALKEANERIAELESGLKVAKAAVREAFVDGAKWWEWQDKSATMWPSDQRRAEDEAEKRYPHAPWAHLQRIRELERQAAGIRVEVWREVAEFSDALVPMARLEQAEAESQMHADAAGSMAVLLTKLGRHFRERAQEAESGGAERSACSGQVVDTNGRTGGAELVVSESASQEVGMD